MVEITVSGRGTSVTDALHEAAVEKIDEALKVFEISPMNADVVLRVDKNPSRRDSAICEITVFVRDAVVRASVASDDMYAAIDEAAKKVTRQMRKYKTRVIERHHRAAPRMIAQSQTEDFDALLASLNPDAEDDEVLVREKIIDVDPMTEEEALVQIDLIGHDFYMFTNSETGLINVAYKRHNGAYGILKPRIEDIDG